MKKILACISLVFALSASVTAMAAVDVTVNDEPVDGYAGANNSVIGSDVGTTGMNTVLIEFDDAKTDPVESNIVYADQADDGFKADASFLIKGASTGDLADGTYTVKFNNNANTGSSTTFTVMTHIDEPVDDLPLGKFAYKSEISDNGTYEVGYVAEGTLNVADYTHVIIEASKDGGEHKFIKYALSDRTTVTGGTVNIGVKLINIDQSIAIHSISLSADASNITTDGDTLSDPNGGVE